MRKRCKVHQFNKAERQMTLKCPNDLFLAIH
jgi:hypothetical protein